jgi:hypothetical protein
MTELYCGPTTDFLDEVTHNRMAETLRRAWFDDRGFDPSPSEVRSWRNSLKALANAVRLAALTDHGILLEYQLPLSSLRIDALITGTDQDGRPGAVIVELKQWDDAAASRVPECVVVDYGGKPRDVLHPSAQAGQYRMYLADTHTAFHDGAVQLAACAFLHDFIHDDGSELLSARHANLLGVHPLFAGDRLTDLVVFLDDRLGAGGGMPSCSRSATAPTGRTRSCSHIRPRWSVPSRPLCSSTSSASCSTRSWRRSPSASNLTSAPRSSSAAARAPGSRSSL